MAHIALLIPDMRGGGAERVALSLVEGFLERGHEVDLVLLRAQGELLEFLPAGVRVIDLKADRIRRAIRPLARYFRDSPPDALLAVMWPMPVIALAARLLAGARTRIVTSDHGILSQHYRSRLRHLAALRVTSRLAYPRADARIAASGAIAGDVAALSGLKPNGIAVIPNPIASPPDSIAGQDEANQMWGGPGVRILTVGMLKPEKNHRFLLRAFAELAKARPARLMILGEGPLRQDLVTLAERLGIADRVAMPGFFPDPWPFYASTDVFVLSSRSEGFGNVLVEAMAAGVPVVSTDCGGPRDLLAGGQFGRLVPVDDIAALRMAMEEAISVPVEIAKLKKRAAEFRPDKAVDAYLSVLLTGKMGVQS